MGRPSSVALSCGWGSAASAGRGAVVAASVSELSAIRPMASPRANCIGKYLPPTTPVLSTLQNAMTRLALAVSGKTLGWAQGFAGLRPAGLGYKVQRAALTALTVGALIASLSATSVAMSGVPESGVETDEHGNVTAVSPTGFAWAGGVRVGQVVVSSPRVEADDWRLVTRDRAGDEHVADGRPNGLGLAASMPIGLVAVFLAALSLLFLSTRRRWVV